MSFRSFLVLSVVLFGVVFAAERIELVVTGEPASQELIMESLGQLIQNDYYWRNATDFSNNDEYLIGDLYLGQWQQFNIPKNVSENEELNISVYNQPLQKKRITSLYVSNEPEDIKQAGSLLKDFLFKDKPIRLFYYHKNRLTRNLTLTLVLENRSKDRATVHVTQGLGGPDSDGIYVGHVAARKFLKYLSKNEGFFYKVASHQKGILLTQKLKPNEIAAGIVDLSLLDVDHLFFRLLAEDYSTKGLAKYMSVNEESNEKRIGGVFISPYKELHHTMNLSQDDYMVLRIGDEPFIVDNDSSRQLRGNYGLLYDYNISLNNNTDQDREISVLFYPNGGVANGVFVINGSIFEAFASSKNSGQQNIYKVLIKAGDKKMLKLTTFPQAGSNYPVSLIIRSKVIK